MDWVVIHDEEWVKKESLKVLGWVEREIVFNKKNSKLNKKNWKRIK